MNVLIKKSLGIVLIALLYVSQAFSFAVIDDQKDLMALADGFANAMSKKDKAWMDANLTNECMTHMPTGESVNKQSTIQAFTGALYDIQKSLAANKSFKVADKEAGGSADYTVEGSAVNGGDISGTYKLSFKFQKTEFGWKISEILINGE